MTAKNPARDLAEIKKLFNQFLMEPGESLIAAQDLLEENALTLYDVSISQPANKMQAGNFQIGYPPANVSWAYTERHGKRPAERFAITITVFYGGSSWIDGIHDAVFGDRQDAIYRVIERAWNIVKIMKIASVEGIRARSDMQQVIDHTVTEGRDIEPHTPDHLIAPHKAQRRQQRGRRARPRDNSAHGPQGRLRDRDQRHFLVIRINRDNGDTYATEVGQNVKHALEELLDVAMPDEGAVIEYMLVWARDAGMARVLTRADSEGRAHRWYPISALQSAEDMIEEHDEDRYRPRENPTPKALRMYRGFHQLEPKKLGDFHPDLVIPDVCVCVGDALHVLYRSDKLNPETGEDEGMIDYIHEHGRGVRIYRCDNGAEGEITTVPAWIRNTKELVKLGDCNGFAYADIAGGKKRRANATPPYPELYTTPSGKCLLVIQSKKRLLALIWGGRLGVEPRGIVH